MDKVIEIIKMPEDDLLAEKKRHMAYTQGTLEAYVKMGTGRRKRVGFCNEIKVKAAFPSEYFTEFRGISENNLESDCTTSSSKMSIIQLLD